VGSSPIVSTGPTDRPTFKTSGFAPLPPRWQGGGGQIPPAFPHDPVSASAKTMRALALTSAPDEGGREVLEFDHGVRAHEPTPGGCRRIRWQEAGRRRESTAPDRAAAMVKAEEIVERLGQGTEPASTPARRRLPARPPGRNAGCAVAQCGACARPAPRSAAVAHRRHQGPARPAAQVRAASRPSRQRTPGSRRPPVIHRLVPQLADDKVRAGCRRGRPRSRWRRR
jgi:hypothetical protein